MHRGANRVVSAKGHTLTSKQSTTTDKDTGKKAGGGGGKGKGRDREELTVPTKTNTIAVPREMNQKYTVTKAPAMPGAAAMPSRAGSEIESVNAAM